MLIRNISTIETDDGWVRIGGLCSAGRRSLWFRGIERSDATDSMSRDEATSRIELCAGRSGDDIQVTIDRSNPQFAELLELFLIAEYAVLS